MAPGQSGPTESFDLGAWQPVIEVLAQNGLKPRTMADYLNQITQGTRVCIVGTASGFTLEHSKAGATDNVGAGQTRY